MGIKSFFRLLLFRIKFRNKFPHSDILPMRVFPLEIVDVGKFSYGELDIITFNNKSKLKIGCFVSIAQNVHFLLDVEHHYDYMLTFPFKVKVLKSEKCEAFSKGDIVIEDDVWIGYGATILSGVRIGKGAVIAACSVVTKDVQPYTIVGGNPAKTIKKRFNNFIIDKLYSIDYSKLTEEKIRENIERLYDSKFHDYNISL